MAKTMALSTCMIVLVLNLGVSAQRPDDNVDLIFNFLSPRAQTLLQFWTCLFKDCSPNYNSINKPKEGHRSMHRIQNQPTWKSRHIPPAINNRPIIGVLAQETDIGRAAHGDTYFMASYVKFLEMGGARVVPVRVGEELGYYTSLFQKINGLIFPGGEVDVITSKYAQAAKIMFNLAKKANTEGDYFPLFGICQGHELLSALVTGRKWFHDCDAEKLMLPLVLSEDASHSRMVGEAPKDTLHIMATYNVTANMHVKCLTPQNFTKSGLDKFFRIVSTNRGRQGIEFVSTMEAMDFPFYGTQWHPEKNVFIWDVSIPLNHSRGAVQVTQYFANFFVEEARRSQHHFPDLKSEAAELIQNYHPLYSGAPSFNLDYYFNLTGKNHP